MIRPILQVGHPVLRQKASDTEPGEIGSPDMVNLIEDLIDTMRAADGAGIAGNQVGALARVCVIGVNRNPRYPHKPAIPLTVLINPRVRLLDDERFLNNEGCLSVPVRGELQRYMNIEVEAFDRSGRPFRQVYRGLSAGTVQHEMDHLDGVLIVDRIEDNRTMATWDMFHAHQEKEYLKRIAPVIEATEPRVD